MNKSKVYTFIIRCFTVYIRLLLLLALPVVAVWSWISSLYTDPSVNSLLDSDGIRWSISNIITNLYEAPIVESLIIMMCSGALFESGLLGTIFTVIKEMKWNKSSVSLKQRRALMFTVFVFEVMLVLFVVQLFSPNGMLLSAFGSFENSAISKGMPGLIALLVLIISNVFGYSSGKIVTLSDFVNAHTAHIKSCAGYFVTAFFVAEFIACIHFTGLMNAEATSVLSCLLYYIPLIVQLTSSILLSSTYHT